MSYDSCINPFSSTSSTEEFLGIHEGCLQTRQLTIHRRIELAIEVIENTLNPKVNNFGQIRTYTPQEAHYRIKTAIAYINFLAGNGLENIVGQLEPTDSAVNKVERSTVGLEVELLDQLEAREITAELVTERQKELEASHHFVELKQSMKEIRILFDNRGKQYRITVIAKKGFSALRSLFSTRS